MIPTLVVPAGTLLDAQILTDLGFGTALASAAAGLVALVAVGLVWIVMRAAQETRRERAAAPPARRVPATVLRHAA